MLSPFRYLTLLGVSVLLFTRATAAQESVPQPLAEWKFDKITLDAEKNRQFPGSGLLAVPASIVGNVRIFTDKFGNSALFSPSEPGFISLPVDLNESLSGPFSVVAWVQLQGKQSDNGTIFRAGKSFSIRVQHSFLNVACDNNWKAIVSGSSTQLIGGWSMIAGINTGKEVILYVDGVEIARHAVVAPARYQTPIYVGARPPEVQNPKETSITDTFNGLIRSIAIYNVALSLPQLKALLSSGNPVAPL